MASFIFEVKELHIIYIILTDYLYTRFLCCKMIILKASDTCIEFEIEMRMRHVAFLYVCGF